MMALASQLQDPTGQRLDSSNGDVRIDPLGASSSHSRSQHPAKRQRILACKRCRHRKQKCDGDGETPCSNCRRASEECEPTEPALVRARYNTEYVRSLEQRLAHVERLIPQDALSRIERSIMEDDTLPSAEKDQLLQDQPQSALRSNEIIGFSSQDIQSNQFSARLLTESVSSYAESTVPGNEAIQPSDDAAPAVNLYCNSHSPARTHHSQGSHASVHNQMHSPELRRISLGSSPHGLGPPDNNVTSVMATIPSSRSSQQDNHQDDGSLHPPSVGRYLNQLAVWPDAIPPSVESHLIDIYFENANTRFPFLLRETFNVWHTAWSQRSPETCHDLWQGFFVNMLFAVGLLLDPKNPTSVSYTSQNFYDQAVNRYLPLVLKHSNRLLHVQAHLMMSLHAIFSPSTEKIVLMISSTIRCCILAQFHLAEAEPEPIDDATRIEIQMRRRAFWVAYGLDRLACGVLRIPFSIADDNITVPLFDNIDDSSLSQGSLVSINPLAHTSVSAALHQERCRTIQSEILNVTMRADFAINHDSLSNWRAYILSKLDRWRSQLQDAAENNTNRPTDWRWILIVYNHCLLFLHIPNKSNVRGPAGDWSLRASIQTIMIFRKFQSYKTIPHPWLGLISQFSVGITILYCFWATPPKFRSDAYDSKKVSEAIRACSNNITIMVERWDRAQDLLDVFELLATEVPLIENSTPFSDDHRGRSTTRISNDAVDEIRVKMPNVKSIVLNREIIRMIQEMIVEDFPEAGDDAPIEAFASLGDKVTLGQTTSSQTFPDNHSNNTPSYQFPSLYLSNSQSSSEIGTLLMGQTLEFPDNLAEYDIY